MGFILNLINRLRNQDNRTKNSAKNSMYMLIIKCVSLVISFLYVPLLLSQLDAINYGIWLTLTSLVSWCSFMDIGLGHGLRNNLTKSITEGDFKLARKLVSTSYAILFLIVIIASVFVILVFSHFNWSKILNAPKEFNNDLTILAIITLVSFLFNFVLRLLNSILLAIQKPAFSSVIEVSSQFITFVVIVIMANLNHKFSLLEYGTVISVLPVIVLTLYTFILFSTKLKDLSFKISYIEFSLAGDLFYLGVKFFLIQLSAIALFQTNNFILTHVVGLSAVTDFNISYKYIGIISVFFGIIITPLWSATTDAYYRGDVKWIEGLLKKMKVVFLLFVLAGILMVICSGFVYKIWLQGQIRTDYIVQLLVLFYFSLNMWCGIHCNIINGIGKVKLQFLITTSEAVLHIPLAVILGNFMGIYGVLTSMILMTLINAIWEPIQVKKLLNKTAVKIWNS